MALDNPTALMVLNDIHSMLEKEIAAIEKEKSDQKHSTSWFDHLCVGEITALEMVKGYVDYLISQPNVVGEWKLGIPDKPGWYWVYENIPFASIDLVFMLSGGTFIWHGTKSYVPLSKTQFMKANLPVPPKGK